MARGRFLQLLLRMIANDSLGASDKTVFNITCAFYIDREKADVRDFILLPKAILCTRQVCLRMLEIAGNNDTK